MNSADKNDLLGRSVILDVVTSGDTFQLINTDVAGVDLEVGFPKANSTLAYMTIVQLS